MIVELRLDEQRPRAWIGRMMTLGGGAHDVVRIKWSGAGRRRPRGLEALFELERVVLRKGRACGADAVDKDSLHTPAGTDEEPDIIVDFTTTERDATCSPKLYLRPLYNGSMGEDAALKAILCGDLPRIEIRDEISGDTLDAGQPSGETADGLSGALDTVMARTFTLLKAVLSGRPRCLQSDINVSGAGHPRSPASYVLLGLAEAIAKRIASSEAGTSQLLFAIRYSPPTIRHNPAGAQTDEAAGHLHAGIGQCSVPGGREQLQQFKQHGRPHHDHRGEQDIPGIGRRKQSAGDGEGDEAFDVGRQPALRPQAHWTQRYHGDREQTGPGRDPKQNLKYSDLHHCRSPCLEKSRGIVTH